MNFHIPTAMQLTATMSMIIGLALALTLTGFPATLRQPMRLWVRGLLIQPFSYALFSLRGQVPDWLSIIVANALLVIAFAHITEALRIYSRKSPLTGLMLVLVGLAVVGEILLTYVWPSLYGRIILISVMIGLQASIGVEAIYRKQDSITRPEHLVALMLLVGVAIMIVRVAIVPAPGFMELTMSSPLQGIVFTYAALLPVIATSGFLLMCGERLNKDLARLATIDPLTGVYNRRTMAELANKAIATSKRHGRSLSLLILDIDHFKRINDQFGHEAGDLALCRVVEIMHGVLRGSDVIARIGGEEFVAILPDSNEAAAANLAERLRERLEESDFSVSGWPVPLRASIGVGSMGPSISNLETLLRETDRAMYAAKRTGRNRVVAASTLEKGQDGVAGDRPEISSGSY
ncbi:GGDEF domain-containing protein [Dokdonella sp.]|uniref:GGDEF domain-containing protein n=1 Tax=Dokdonella sp. TaxID=2291710 RepID=UPI003529B0D5